MSFIHWNKSMSSASHQRHLACCRLQALTCPRASCSEVWCSQQYTRRSPVPQQTTAPFRLHSWTSFPCQQDREDSTYPTLVMLWGWTETWCRIWNNLQVKHEGHMDVSVCPTWASPMNFLQPAPPLTLHLGEGMAGWGRASGTTAFTSHLFHKSSLLHMPVTDSYGRTEGGRSTSLPRQESWSSMRDVFLGRRNLLHLCTQDWAMSTYSCWVGMTVFSFSSQINRAHCSWSQR